MRSISQSVAFFPTVRSPTPGANVFEPSGNEAWWNCYGDEPRIVRISMPARLTYINQDGSDADFKDPSMLRRQYIAWCEANGYETSTISTLEDN